MYTYKVGIIMGGRSLEREVSLNSARTICDHLDSARYEIIPLFHTPDNRLYILPVRFLHRGKISDFEARLDSEAQEIIWDDLKKYIDIAYIAQHGRYGEDGCLQGLLEILQIPYVGSKVFASAIGMNKPMAKEFLKSNGIAVPHGFFLNVAESIRADINHITSMFEKYNLQFPVIIKPEQEGSSFGISVAQNLKELITGIERASTIYHEKRQGVIVEEYLRGMEFSCIIITDYKTGKLRALSPTEIVAESAYYDYGQKYMPGRATKFTPARCNPECLTKIQEVSVQVMQTLGMTNLARIDGFLLSNGSIIITDPNSFAGMSPSSFTFLQAAQEGLSHTDLINHLLETELYELGLLQPKLYDTEKKFMNTQTRLRVAVLFGGRSNEKEISLESGRNIIYKLSPQNYEAIALFVNSELKLFRISQRLLVFNSTKEIEAALTADMYVAWHDLPKIADFVFIGLHGGEGENGAVQGMLEIIGLPYNGSGVLTSALCMDKFKTNNYLRSKGFAVPKGILFTREEWLKNRQSQFDINYPLIIKPHDDGCSVLVSKAQNQEELEHILQDFFSTEKNCVLIEEYITGMELTVGVIGNEYPQALPPSKAVACAGILSIEEKFLPGAGENQTPAPLSENSLKFVRQTIEEVYKAVHARGYARIDCFYQSPEQSPTREECLVILEINTLPGLTPATCIFHQAAEINLRPMDFIDRIIKLGLSSHAQVEINATQKIDSLQQEIL